MKENKTSNQWFSIVLAMWVTVVISMIALLILEFIIPFSRNVKDVENWSSAYYNAYSWIEESLWELSQQVEDWFWLNTIMSPWATGSKYDLISMTDVIPPLWEWNTEQIDKDWNMFDANTPIQLSLTDNAWVKINSIDFWQTDFSFRVPDIEWSWTKSLSWSNHIIINWIVSWLDWSWNPVVLNASGSTSNNNFITSTMINAWSTINIWNKDGLTLDWVSCTIQEFFSNISCVWWVVTRPVLKMSIVNSLEDSASWIIPYLEYQISFKNSWSTPVDVPWRYSQIKTAWKSYGYKKTMDIKVPQLSTNQAFDFAVFQ
jgi:hypothetical protein